MVDAITIAPGANKGGMMAAQAFLRRFWDALGGDAALIDRVAFTGTGHLRSAFAVTDVAAAAIGAACLALGEWIAVRHDAPAIRVDRRLASFWFGSSLRPQGWPSPPQWDALSGDYRTADGWVRLHCNAPHHRRAAMTVLGLGPRADKAEAGAKTALWSADALEQAVVTAGGCAALMRSHAAWRHHAQGRAVAQTPAVTWHDHDMSPLAPRAIDVAHPLAGIKVLDLTRVLAGPVATRFLAGAGATILRLDPPGWDEPAVVPETMRGKYGARCDLHAARDRRQFEALLADADILVHGYRADALCGLGYDAAWRRRHNPALADISLNAYGFCGPWHHRRGYDSLVQMSTGIAEAGMVFFAADRPTPLPVQALDHATGYLLAAGAIRGLTRSYRDRRAVMMQTSLAHMAAFLWTEPPGDGTLTPETDDDLALPVQATPWGDVRWVKTPMQVDGVEFGWPVAPAPLGGAQLAWPHH